MESRVFIKLPLTHRKVSALPPKNAPYFKVVNGALRYTFELTDVAVSLPIGKKVLAYCFLSAFFNNVF